MDEALHASMLGRLRESAVTDALGRALHLPGEGQVVIGRVCDAEPLLHTERFLGLDAADRLTRGLGALALLGDASRAVLAVDGECLQVLARLQAAASGTLIEVVSIPPRTPLGADDLICDLTLSLEDSAVFDAVVLNDVALALEGRAPLRRTVTVAGHVRAPAVVRAPLGTSVADLVQACGGAPTSPLGWVSYHNGALGGRQVGRDAAVDLDTRGVVVLPHDHPLVRRDTTPLSDHLRRVPAACSSCSICTESCPSRLNGSGIAPQQLMLSREEATLSALECVGCRTCTQLCPAGLDPSAVIQQIAADLRRRGVELADKHCLEPHPDRLGRRVAVRRMTERLGLHTYDYALHRDPRAGRSLIPDRITLPLRSPTGGERVPVVSGGETVHMGDVVALAAAGSREVDLRSPVEGRVHGVDPDDGVLIAPL